MPEIRYSNVYKQGAYPPELLEKVPYEVSDNELLDEQEQAQLETDMEQLDNASMGETIVIMKRTLKRLHKKGIL